MSNLALTLAITGLILLLCAVLVGLAAIADECLAARRRHKVEWHPPKPPRFARLRRWWAEHKARRHRAHQRKRRVLMLDDETPLPDARSSIEQHKRILGRTRRVAR